MRRWLRLQFVVVFGAAAVAAHAAEPGGGAAPALAGLKLTPQDSFPALLDAAQSDAAPVRWRSTQVQLTPKARLRISVAAPLTVPEASPALLARAADAQAYEVSLVRDWPGAVSFSTGPIGVDLSPHAAVGLTPYGGLAEAGARLELGQRMDKAAAAGLNAMGVGDGARFGDKGRWYLFAAASGRAVGLNMLHGEAGWNRAGWTTDQSSTLVGDAQVGVGWRRGAMQTSLGVLHREVKGEHTYFGYTSRPDTMAAFSFAIRPGR